MTMTEHAVTQLLGQMSSNDSGTRARLFDLLLGDLRVLASGLMKGERIEHTLQATALVNEAYLRANGFDGAQNRSHLFGIATKAMRRILVDHARAREAGKRGGGLQRHPIDDVIDRIADTTGPMPEVNEALDILATEMPEAAVAIELRYFGGLSNREVSEHQGVTERTIERHLKAGRRRLYELLHD